MSSLPVLVFPFCFHLQRRATLPSTLVSTELSARRSSLDTDATVQQGSQERAARSVSYAMSERVELNHPVSMVV